MGKWSTEFRAALKRTETGVYAPQFRLVIGTPAISSKIGAWERPIAKVLEIGSHPGVATYAGVTGAAGKGSVFGAPYQFLVGLTDQITVGAQSVSSRKFQYSGAQMSVVVTRAAAQFAMQMPIGTLSRLQCRMKGNDVPDTDFETIHYGTYRGCKWNGSSYTLSFGDALEASEQRSTDPLTWTGDGSSSQSNQSYQWFSGCGETTLTSATMTDFSGAANLDTVTTFSNQHYARWGHTYKKPESFGGQDFHYGYLTIPASGATRTLNQWARITNGSSKNTYILFETVAKDPSDGSMKFVKAQSSVGFPLKGLQDGSFIDGGIGMNSTVRQTLIIHGTPVTEIVNTIYTCGYHEQMVCGLFGNSVTEAKECLNLVDIYESHYVFNRAFQRTAGFVPTRSGVIPFFAQAKNPSASGYSDIKKLVGKWGVFPRFKEGGYSVGLTSQSFDRTHMTGRDTLIMAEDIESAEFDLHDPQCKGQYHRVRLKHSDDSSDAPSSASSRYSIEGASPIIPELELNTSDVAPGTMSGNAFFKYFADVIFGNWFANRRSVVNLRLCGLRFAHLAPGDHVDIFLGEVEAGKTVAYGPTVPRASSNRSVLNSVFHADSEQAGEYFVQSVKVDWIGSKVHLTLNRRQASVISKQFKGSIDGMQAEATGQPQADIDGTLNF